MRGQKVDMFPWRCRKGYTASNVMIVCDHDAVIRYCIAGFEGSASDSQIWSDKVNTVLSELPDDTFLLGDAGFGLSSQVMVPYR